MISKVKSPPRKDKTLMSLSPTAGCPNYYDPQITIQPPGFPLVVVVGGDPSFKGSPPIRSLSLPH